MDNTKTEPDHQGKHLFTVQSLHLKPSKLLLGLLFACDAASAQNGGIHRCIGENGEPTFSDQKCNALKATVPSEPPISVPGQFGVDSFHNTNPTTATITQTCAISAEALRTRVADAFQSANAVGFSGLFLWDGYGQGSAVAPLRDLATLVRQPLLSLDVDSTMQFREPDQPEERQERHEGDTLHEMVIRTVVEQQRNVPVESVHRYTMREQTGCWWLLIPL